MAVDKNTDDFCTALHEAVARMKQTFPAGIGVGKADFNAIYGRPSIEMKIEKKMADEDEWIWVEGYKGTNYDMTCRGYQFALGGQTDMPEGVPIEVCESGFHFCLELKHVFYHYDIGYDNRFFKVRALVRKKDFDNYDTYAKGSIFLGYGHKLTSKSIIFLSECTMDEIFADATYKDWTEDEKRLALKHGVNYVKNERFVTKLMGYGYTRPFATWLVDHGKYQIAAAVGSQTDLSMDMKCLAIFK